MMLLEALKKIRVEGPVDTGTGICGNLSCLLGEIPFVFNSLVQKWPQFSGSIWYPVSGSKTFLEHSRRNALWKGEQRDLRMSLINFCIKELENENLTSDSTGSR